MRVLCRERRPHDGIGVKTHPRMGMRKWSKAGSSEELQPSPMTCASHLTFQCRLLEFHLVLCSLPEWILFSLPSRPIGVLMWTWREHCSDLQTSSWTLQPPAWVQTLLHTSSSSSMADHLSQSCNFLHTPVPCVLFFSNKCWLIQQLVKILSQNKKWNRVKMYLCERQDFNLQY